jgi:nucleotide-binding universal stress UspA family protein
MSSEGAEVELLISLDQAPGASPSLRQLLRQAAARTIGPSLSLWHRLTLGATGAESLRANAIVVGVPASRRSHPPLAQAAYLSVETGATLHLVAVRRMLDGDGAVEVRASELAEELRGRGLAVEAHLRSGDPAAALLEVAREVQARLLVVDGSAPMLEHLTSSTWDHVAHHAPCDVLIARWPVRGPDA